MGRSVSSASRARLLLPPSKICAAPLHIFLKKILTFGSGGPWFCQLLDCGWHKGPHSWLSERDCKNCSLIRFSNSVQLYPQPVWTSQRSERVSTAARIAQWRDAAQSVSTELSKFRRLSFKELRTWSNARMICHRQHPPKVLVLHRRICFPGLSITRMCLLQHFCANEDLSYTWECSTWGKYSLVKPRDASKKWNADWTNVNHATSI